MWLQGTPGTDKYTVQIHADMRMSESQRNTSWLYSTIQYYTVSKEYCVSGYHLHKLENIICHTWLHLNRIKITPSNKVC